MGPQHRHLNSRKHKSSAICCCSVAKLCPTLYNPMTGFPVLHYLPEFAQTHVHWVSDVIQPPHLLSPSSPPALNLSQQQCLFQGVNSSYQVAEVLELQPSVLPMNIQGWFPLGLTGLISLQSKGLSGVFSSITIWKHQFFGSQSSLGFNLNGSMKTYKAF